MSNGVGVDDACLTAFQSFLKNKTPKYIIFRINPKFTDIIVEKTSDATDWADFLADLPKTECRWAVYDFGYGEGKSKAIFVSWAPDAATMKERMYYSASIGTLRARVGTPGLEVHASDYSELDYATVLAKVR